MIRVLYMSISEKQARDVIKAYTNMDGISVDLNKLVCMTKKEIQEIINKLDDTMLLECALMEALDK